MERGKERQGREGGSGVKLEENRRDGEEHFTYLL